MQVGVVYAVGTGQIRWIHVPDRPGAEVRVSLLADEAVVVLPLADLATLQAAVHVRRVG